MSKLLSFLKNTPSPQHEIDVNDVNDISDDFYYKMNQLIEEEFPNSPFSVALDSEDLLKLDDAFTSEKSIFIKDDRASCPVFGFPNNDTRKNGLTSHTLVKQVDDKPITLRQILNTIINVQEYKDMVKYTDHNFLEGFSKTTDIQYNTFFGS